MAYHGPSPGLVSRASSTHARVLGRHASSGMQHPSQYGPQLPQDVRERAVDTNSPPASPSIATPSEMTISSDVAEPPESRDEMMDLSD